MDETTRIDGIDIAKGAAIILVVMGHVTSSYHAAGLYKSSLLLNFSSHFIYSFHMASFMFISGLLFKNKSNKENQIKGILLSYGIPYVTFSIIWWVFKTVLSSFVNSQLTILNLVLIPVFPISFLWFIYALMIMEIIQVLLGRQSKCEMIIQVCIGLVMFVVQPFISGIGLFGTEYHFSDFVGSDIMANYVFFCLGLHLGKKIIVFIENHIVIVALGGVSLILGNIVIYRHPAINNAGLKLLLAFMGICCLIVFGMCISSRLLIFIGKRTLPIYVLHGLCIAATRVLLGKMHLHDPVGIIPLIVCTVVGTAIPLVIYEISKRVLKLDFFFTPRKYIQF